MGYSKQAVGMVLGLCTATAAFALPNEHFQGKPEFKAGDDLGAFVWHDEAGQHVRFTTKGVIPHKFSGKICGESVSDLHPHELEAADSANVGPEGHCVVFEMHVDGGVDGFDFRVAGDVVRYEFHQDGGAMGAALIRIGAQSHHPADGSFVLNRK